MQWDDLFRAVALMMVLEGLLPFVAPERWRELMQRMTQQDPRLLRMYAGALMIGGLLLLNFARP